MMFVSIATPAAPLAGETAATLGAASDPQMKTGVSSVRGAGAAAAKSAELLSVACQPDPARHVAGLFLRGRPPPRPLQKAPPPQPGRSATVAQDPRARGGGPPF